MKNHNISTLLLASFTAIFSTPVFSAVPLMKTGTCPDLVADRTAGVTPPRMLNTPLNIYVKQFPNTIQRSQTPQNSVNCSMTTSEFRVEMWASEANVGNIKALQAFAFDARGRLWAVETFDYPNTITAPFAGNDRVVILEDTDGDHVMDSHKVFVSGLNIPQGIEIVPAGVIVTMSPHIVLFTDNNNDDIADSPTGTILYTGFNKGDTHGSVNNPRFGIDNRLWGKSGYNGGNVSGTALTQGVWRAMLDGSRMEQFATTNNNSSGLGFMEDGQVFASTANNNHTNHAVLPNAPTAIISSYGESYMYQTLDIQNGDWPGGFTAASNHEIYTARLFPSRYWNKSAFVCEGTGHLVNLDFLTPNISTWRATRNATDPNVFASTDAWTAPIVAKVGPDGALWVLDWYNYLFLHNGDNPQGAGAAWCGTTCGPGGTSTSPLRTKIASRIYRIVPSNGIVEPVLDLRNTPFDQLVQTFRNTNMFWRLEAQKMILRKATTPALKTQVETFLLQAAASSVQDATDNDPYALHAMWTAQGLGLFTSNPTVWNPVLNNLLLHPASGVRMNVVKAMPLTAAMAEYIKGSCRANDPNPQVRLQAFLALAAMPQATSGAVPVYAPYHTATAPNGDAYAVTAYGRAGTKVVNSAAVVAGCPSLNAVVSVAPANPAMPWKNDIRFKRSGNGNLDLIPNGRLPMGELILYSTNGKALGRASYDGVAWSNSIKVGNVSLLLYNFNGVGGIRFQGRILENQTF